MTKVLIVDDDTSLVKLLGDYLSRLGYEVEKASSGASAITAVSNAPPDLIFLDVMMPDIDGWQTLERLRGFAQTPVIMLTAMGDEPDVLRGFALGADDYISKPFSFAQLSARAEAVLKRSSPGGSEDILKEGDLVVDTGTHRVQRGNEHIELTPTEFKLLVALMQQPGKVLTPRQLVIQVWGTEYANDADYVRRYVWHLRRKIEPDPTKSNYVHNQRGVGYYFSAYS